MAKLLGKHKSHTVGDLQVWWIPQVPMSEPFAVDVASVEEGVKVMRTLAEYDLYQLKHRIKPDFCNAGGLRRWCDDSDGEGNPGWEDWCDEETGHDDPGLWLAEREAAASIIKAAAGGA